MGNNVAGVLNVKKPEVKNVLCLLSHAGFGGRAEGFSLLSSSPIIWAQISFSRIIRDNTHIS